MTRMRKVRFEPLGITIECDATEPILQVALRQGLRLVDYRCADGECGGCRARVRSGQVAVVAPPEHVLSAADQAQGHVLLCRTHVQSDLVVELLAGSLLAPPVRAERPRPPTEALLGPLAAAAELLSDGLVVLDAQGELLLVNRAAAQLLHLDPAPKKRSILRKLREIAYALQAEQRLRKDEILELYLNVVEWGPQIHGVGAASCYYFGVPPAALTPEESARLVAVLPSPPRLGPALRAESGGHRIGGSREAPATDAH